MNDSKTASARPGRSMLTMRLTDEGKRLLGEIAARRGVSQTAIVELLVRAEAQSMGVASPVATAAPEGVAA